MNIAPIGQEYTIAQPLQQPPKTKVFGKVNTQILNKINQIASFFTQCCFCKINCLKGRVQIQLHPEKQIQKSINLIDVKESLFKQKRESILTAAKDTKQVLELSKEANQLHDEWKASIKQAFSTAVNVVKSAKLDAVHLPKDVALQFTEILWYYGLSLYANPQSADPFECSLDVLKAALLMQQYALGLSEECPDVTALESIEDLHNKESVRNDYRTKAEKVIDTLDQEKWAEKAVSLNEKQLVFIPRILRYIDGAMGYLNKVNLVQAEKLILTAQAVLAKARDISSFNPIKINDELAELVYNNMTGFFINMIEWLGAHGQKEKAEGIWQELEGLWTACVILSAEPEKMKARCFNKRSILYQLTPEETVKFRKAALASHLSIPVEKQDQLLIALAWNNLSHAHEDAKQIAEALKATNEAYKLACKCESQGIHNIQFANIYNRVEYLFKKYKKSEATNASVAE